MTRMVVVSNRVSRPDADADAQGGLAVAVRRALANRGGVWFGWSGRVVATPTPINSTRDGNTEYLTTDLTDSEHEGYYRRFCSNILWPLFHFNADIIDFDKSDYAIYRRANSRFADELVENAGPAAMTWVHDFHCIPLGRCLRMRGVDGAIGYFHHVPCPGWDLMRVLPVCNELLEDFLSYDFVAFQTDNDKESFIHCLVRAFGALPSADGKSVFVKGRRLRVAVMPLGVDVDAMRTIAATEGHAHAARLTQRLGGRKLIVKASQLDPSKGLLGAFTAFERYLRNHADQRDNVKLLAITPMLRESESTLALRDALCRRAGAINGHFGAIDQSPLTHLATACPHNSLLALFGVADVALVTPLRDGMSLVAKEFVASQDPEDPGVLILSSLAGAAAELDAALLIHPYQTNSIVAALDLALRMPLTERIERHQAMLARLKRFDIDAWVKCFTDTLIDCARTSRAGAELDYNADDNDDARKHSIRNLAAG